MIEEFVMKNYSKKTYDLRVIGVMMLKIVIML